jgi:hypothetical protein
VDAVSLRPRECSSMAELQLPKLVARVRFPSLAPQGPRDRKVLAVTTAAINPTVAPSGTGCVDCDAVGGWWVHLRRCAECGHIGCCDSSLAKHATAHAKATGHPVIRSFEPGEDWFFDYRTGQFIDGPTLAAPLSHPLEQTVPGPASRVPADWQTLLAADGQP